MQTADSAHGVKLKGINCQGLVCGELKVAVRHKSVVRREEFPSPLDPLTLSLTLLLPSISLALVGLYTSMYSQPKSTCCQHEVHQQVVAIAQLGVSYMCLKGWKQSSCRFYSINLLLRSKMIISLCFFLSFHFKYTFTSFLHFSAIIIQTMYQNQNFQSRSF